MTSTPVETRMTKIEPQLFKYSPLKSLSLQFIFQMIKSANSEEEKIAKIPVPRLCTFSLLKRLWG